MFGIKQSFVFFYVSSRQVHVVLDIVRENYTLSGSAYGFEV